MRCCLFFCVNKVLSFNKKWQELIQVPNKSKINKSNGFSFEDLFTRINLKIRHVCVQISRHLMLTSWFVSTDEIFYPINSILFIWLNNKERIVLIYFILITKYSSVITNAAITDQFDTLRILLWIIFLIFCFFVWIAASKRRRIIYS